jgi:hypothetical protein
MNARIPIYQQLLGGKDDNYRQSQILMDIAQRGLGFAANVDDQGRPLTGSFASRLAGAARTLPGTINAINAEKAKEGMAIKQMALGQAEKDVSAARGQNEKLVESQRKLFGDILKAAGKGGGAELFGKGAWEWKTVNTPGLMDRFSKGETTPEEDGLIQSAYSKLTKPQIESYTDPFSGNRVEKTIPGFQIPFVEEAMRQRAKLGAGGTGAAPVPAAPAGQPSTGQGSPAPTPATVARIEKAIANLLHPITPAAQPQFGQKYPCSDEEFVKGLMLYYELGLFAKYGIGFSTEKNPYTDGFEGNRFWFSKI